MASAATVTVLSTVTASAATHAATAAAPQAGVLEGSNPVHYDPKDPIILFIVQASIIIIFCRLLYFPLKYFGQPRVIAEVIGGIILGPSVMARIPGFQQAIFPAESMPVLANVANLGLIIFMFITALEVDLNLFLQNWKVAVSVSFAGLVLPFGMGCGIAVGIYNEFAGDMVKNVNFGVFALFVGTAIAITAFPVLCRILTELNLLGTSVGVTTLAAGVGNDVVGWILLALCVSLVNNASGLAALWALLCCVGWILLLVFAVRPAFIWMLKRSGSLQDGPSPGMVTMTLLLVLCSSFFTGIIGVHPIFGGFLVGLICPHEGGFAIKLTQKIEDFVGVLFLPLYFALSGLKTDIGLLNDGIVWAYVVAITLLSFAGKIIGGTLAARFCGLLWRESAAIGVLMSCKGLVELIVLNIGLQAGILSPRTFTMFVIMALVTTVTTTPVTKWLYPPWYQKKLERWRRGEIDWDGNPIYPEAKGSLEQLESTSVNRVLVHLRLDSLPSVFTLIALLGRTTGTEPSGTGSQSDNKTPGSEDGALQPQTKPGLGRRHLEVHGLRMLELTDRTSSVMQVTEGNDLSESDPVVNVFRTFSQLHEVAVSGKVAIVPTHSYAETLADKANDVGSDLVVIPWSHTGSLAEDQFSPHSVSQQDRFNDRSHLDFVNGTLRSATCSAAVFIDNGFGGPGPGAGKAQKPGLVRSVSRLSIRSQRETATLFLMDRTHHVFMPFFGGSDDRVALRFVLQLAKNRLVTVTIANLKWRPQAADDNLPTSPVDEEEEDATGNMDSVARATSASSGRGAADKAAAAVVVETRAAGRAADDAAMAGLRALLAAADGGGFGGRVKLDEVDSSPDAAVQAALERAAPAKGGKKSSGDIVVVGRRHAALPGEKSAARLAADQQGHQDDLRGTLGLVASQLVAGGLTASLLVMKAGARREGGGGSGGGSGKKVGDAGDDSSDEAGVGASR
ncbi:hypothetical protein RB601_009458 [Gaeumannomyces tritici]